MRAARVVCWGFALGEDRGFDIISTHFNPRCEPSWSDVEIRHKCHDAMNAQRANEKMGWLLEKESPHASRSTPLPSSPPRAFGSPWPTKTPVGQEVSVGGNPNATPPNQPKPLPTNRPGVEDDDPYRLAHLFLNCYQHTEGLRLRHWVSSFLEWSEGAYDIVSDATIKKSVNDCIEREFDRIHQRQTEAYLMNLEKGADAKAPKKRRVTRTLLLDTISAIQAVADLNYNLTPPCWIDDGPPARELISCRNGLIHLPTWANDSGDYFTRATPRFFVLNRVNFDFEPDAPIPRAWLSFLNDIWPDDQESIDCLQEWFGYLLTPDTSHHKILFMLGPPRAGKGTIARVLRELVGDKNTASPTLGKLAAQFGLQPLIGKTVAIITDAQLSGRHDQATIKEELLSISGEDSRTIDRKHIESLTMKLPTRFVFLANQMPDLGDSSQALLNRMIILKLTNSFLGREDPELTDRLLTELPGILLWSLQGWKRLQQQRKFTEPQSSADLREEARAIISPISVFVQDRCELRDDGFAPTHEIYAAWCDWCKKHGRERVEHQERFVASLRAALPRLKARRVGGHDHSERVRGYEGIRLKSEYENIAW